MSARFTLEQLQQGRITAYDWFGDSSAEFRALWRETRERGVTLDLRYISDDGQRAHITLRVRAPYGAALAGKYPRYVWGYAEPRAFDAAESVRNGNEARATARPIGEISREALAWLDDHPEIRCPEDWRGKRGGPWRGAIVGTHQDLTPPFDLVRRLMAEGELSQDEAVARATEIMRAAGGTLAPRGDGRR